jgi:hypothetical protein
VNYSSGAPVRQPVRDLPDNDFPVAEETRDKDQRSVTWLRLLWTQRQMLFRVTLYAMLASTALVFLIPSRYESTARLMPPDNQSSSSLAIAAAAMSSTAGAGGLGGIASDLLGAKSTSDVFVGICAEGASGKYQPLCGP